MQREVARLVRRFWIELVLQNESIQVQRARCREIKKKGHLWKEKDNKNNNKIKCHDGCSKTVRKVSPLKLPGIPKKKEGRH